MKIRFVKSLFVGIKEGEVKDLPLYLAQMHIDKGEAEEVKEDIENTQQIPFLKEGTSCAESGLNDTPNAIGYVKVKRSKKDKNEEI